MKIKNNWIAILCLVAVLLACSGVCGFAAEVTDVSLEYIVGSDLVPYKTFDFTKMNASDEYTGIGYVTSGIFAFDTIDGLVLNNAYWRYTPANGWSSIADGRVVTFRTKLADAEHGLALYICEPGNAQNQMYHMGFSADGVRSDGNYDFLDETFAPGTDWVDYLVVKSAAGFHLYANSEMGTGGVWKKILQGSMGDRPSSSEASGLYFSGYGNILSAKIYNTGTFTGVENLDDVADAAVVTAYDFSFDEAFSLTNGITSSGMVSYEKDGLVLSENASWKFSPGSGWYPLSGTNMVGFRLKVSDREGSVTVRFSGQQGSARMVVGSTGISIYGSYATSGNGIAPKKILFSGLDWVDFLVMQNDKNGYSVYLKNDAVNGKWYLGAETKDFFADPQSDMGIQLSGSGTVQYVKQYTTLNTAADSACKPVESDTTYYQEEFVTMPAGQKNLITENAAIDNGKLVLTADSQGSGKYLLKNGAIPLGGYAEFRVMARTNGEFITSDGTTGVSLSFGDVAAVISGASSKTLFVGDGGNCFRTWRILRNRNGSYSGYCKSDGDDAWHQAFHNIVGKAVSSDPQTFLLASAKDSGLSGAVLFDYFKLSGPGKGATLILTDGFGTKVVNEESKYDYFNCLRALVKQNETTPQILLFAEYINGTLSGWQKEEVPAGFGTVSMIYSGQNSASKIKVFLWDGIEKMTPGGVAQTAKLNWELGGNAEDLDGGFVLDAESGESYIALEGAISDTFDVEWTMTIQGYTGNECAELYTGTRKIVFAFFENGIACGDVFIPWEIGTTAHSYRVSGKSGICYLYIDGEFVDELADFPESTEESKLLFRFGKTILF